MIDVNDAPRQIDVDYLVVGSGAMGMAFTDALLSATAPDVTVAIVDRHARPGGHWNDSYPFVRLHQPSAFYGVNSRELGAGTKDAQGWNAGLYELASGTEVVTYFDQVMSQQFLPSGRVQYFPMSTHEGDGRLRSLVSGAQIQVDATKIVDATYMNVQVPSVAGPRYEVAPGVRCVPLNDLATVERPPDGFVVIGAGKTAMDACLFLLANGATPSEIRWVRPRDQWLLDRANIQPGDFFADTIDAFARQAEAVAASTSVDDLFARLEADRLLFRLDQRVRPTMYRCATVTQSEMAALATITDVVRLGRVERIEPTTIVLEEGTIETTPDTLHVDCSSDGLASRPVVPVFAGDRITLQSIRTCQQVFSAAILGHLEATRDDDQEKNELSIPVQHPDSDLDWLRTTLANTLNTIRWRQDEELSTWLSTARLDGLGAARRGATDDAAVLAAVARIAAATGPSVERLQSLLADATDRR